MNLESSVPGFLAALGSIACSRAYESSNRSYFPFCSGRPGMAAPRHRPIRMEESPSSSLPPISIPSSSALLSTPASPADSFEAEKKVIVVVVKGTDEAVRVPTCWTLQKLAHAGDVVVVLAAPPPKNHLRSTFQLASHLVGYNLKGRENSSSKTSKKKVHDKVSRRRREVEKSLSSLYVDSMKVGVELYLDVKKGSIETLGIGHAIMLKATHVVLGRELKMYKRHFVERLACILVQMRHKSPPSTLQGIQSTLAESNLDDTASFCKASPSQFSITQSSSCGLESSNVQNQETNTSMEIGKQPTPTHSEEKGESCIETHEEPIYLSDTSESTYSEISQMTNTSLYLHKRESSLCAVHVCNSPMYNVGHTSHSTNSIAFTSTSRTSSFRSLPTRCNSSEFLSSSSSNNYSDTSLSYMKEVVDTSLVASRNIDQNLAVRKQPNNIQENVKVISVQPRVAHASCLVESLLIKEGPTSNRYYFFGQQEQHTAANGFDILYPGQVTLKERIDEGPKRIVNVDTTTSLSSTSQPSFLLDTKQTLLDENRERNAGLGLSSCPSCKQVTPNLSKRPVLFSHNDLLLATDCFSRTNVLGEDETGVIYKGLLKDGHYVAVKQFRQPHVQVDNNFLIDIEMLSCIQHRNLVMLLGYCAEDTRFLLVYEYVCNKSLSWHLAKENNPRGLEWWARQKIAVGVARGLRYLHEESRGGCTVHGQVGADNIFLTHRFLPIVGNFGLACSQQVKTDLIEVQSDRPSGYLGATRQEISWKADVYAFGVVLLELICGQRAIHSLKPTLVEWARPLLFDGKYHELLDPRLESSYDSYELVCMVRAATLCIAEHPSARPQMSQVLHILERGSSHNDDSIYLEAPFSKNLQSGQKDALDLKPHQLQVVANHSSKPNNHCSKPNQSSKPNKPKRNNYRRVSLAYDVMLS